ncbi:MAG: Signal transduction response regulator / Disease resistance protein [Acidobacteria bacterium]|nr:Signal transduction response regulator / Disease resistance protein [Acidobacteriota bacterium]
MYLPAAVTPLLGRARELDETMRLLARTRLLTITGAGGSGKTRVALELARRVQGSFDDVVWLDLASLADPELIAQQLAGALGLREAAVQDALPMIVESLRERTILLVLDNCEHLVDACALVAETILRGCPEVSIVATSREALGIGGEQTWLVPPLAAGDASALFVERARAVVPSFELGGGNASCVVRICERLDGIPLAIELAAARVKVLSVEQIADRLADAFRLLSAGSRTVPRHRTIREAIDWSYRLLSDDSQVVLRRLAVFAGSFSLGAVEEICGGDGIDVLELLHALIDKSLVMRAPQEREARYRLLETVRQFAAEKLQESGERAAIRDRHAQFFVGMIEAAEPRLFAGATDPAAIAMVDDESGNLRAVFDWAEEDPSRCEPELRLLYALHWYWFARGHFHEGRRRAATALARPCDVPPVVRARALLADASIAVWQGEWQRVGVSVGEALPVIRGTSDLRAVALALTLRATALAYAGDAAAAQGAFDEAKIAARRNGVDVSVALTLYWSGLAAELRGDWAAARADFQEAIGIGEATGNKPAVAHPTTVLGHVALRERKYGEALDCFRRALEIHAEIDDRWGLTHAIEGIGLAMLDTGDAEVGTRLLAAASAAWLRLGARPARLDDFDEEKARRIRQALSNDKLRVALASGAAIPYDEMVALARRESERLAIRDGARPAAAKAAASADGTPLLRVRALGPLEIYRGGELVDVAAQSIRARELLLFLLTHPQGCTKEQIGAALWPDVDPARLRNNFHVTLHRLRKSLGAAELVAVEGETYAIDRSGGFDFDAETFEREVTLALKKKDEALPRLAAAVPLYRGDFFENGSGSGEWLDDVRDRLRDLYARALTTLGRAQLAAGDARAAADAYQRLVQLDDLDEEAARNLMTALARAGDPAAATRAYRRLTESLRRELETEPEPVTTRLHARIAAGEL